MSNVKRVYRCENCGDTHRNIRLVRQCFGRKVYEGVDFYWEHKGKRQK